MKLACGYRVLWVLGLATAACGGGGGGGSDDTAQALAPGEIGTWAGDGVQGHAGDGADRTESRLNQPMDLTFSPSGVVYIADWNNHAIRTVSPNGTIDTLIGQPLPGDWPCQVPGDPTNCEVPLDEPIAASRLAMNHPTDVAILADESLIIAAWHNHKVEHCLPDREEVDVVAGQQSPGFSGDGDAASAAKLNFPDSVVIDADGAALVSDQRSNRVRRIELEGDGTIRTVAGATMPPVMSGFSGEGGPATDAELALAPYNLQGGADNPPPGGGIALDEGGALYVADSFNHCIRRIAPGSDGLIGVGDPAEEVIEAVAGTCGQSGYDGDGGPATQALLHQPHDVEIGPDGDLYIADVRNHAVRAVDLDSNEIRTVAGTGTAGYSGDGGPATDAQLSSPYGVSFDEAGDLYIVDTRNNRIRVVKQ